MSKEHADGKRREACADPEVPEGASRRDISHGYALRIRRGPHGHNYIVMAYIVMADGYALAIYRGPRRPCCRRHVPKDRSVLGLMVSHQPVGRHWGLCATTDAMTGWAMSDHSGAIPLNNKSKLRQSFSNPVKKCIFEPVKKGIFSNQSKKGVTTVLALGVLRCCLKRAAAARG